VCRIATSGLRLPNKEFEMARATAERRTRAPQGAKRVAQAFFSELETVAEDKQAEVAKAAQAMVRETLMAKREKVKVAKAKMRAGRAAPAQGKTAARAERKTPGPSRGRKTPRPRGESSEPAPEDPQETAGES
jgi:hypothetical protein